MPGPTQSPLPNPLTTAFPGFAPNFKVPWHRGFWLSLRLPSMRVSSISNANSPQLLGQVVRRRIANRQGRGSLAHAPASDLQNGTQKFFVLQPTRMTAMRMHRFVIPGGTWRCVSCFPGYQLGDVASVPQTPPARHRHRARPATAGWHGRRAPAGYPAAPWSAISKKGK